MPLQPYKFVIVPVVQEVDARGNVIGEGPLTVTSRDEDGNVIGTEEIRYVRFGCAEVAKFAREFPKELDALNAQQAARQPNRERRRAASKSKPAGGRKKR